MILDRTLPRVLQVTAGEVPALAGRGRDRVVLVTDVEVLCSSIVVDQTRRQQSAPLSLHDLHESLGFLLGQVPVLLATYDPARGRQIHDPYAGGFKGWLHLELTRDLIDYWRSFWGRHGQKRVMDPLPIHDEEGHERPVIWDPIDPIDPIEYGSDARTDRLVAAVEGITTDDPDHWFAGRGWAHLRRDRKAAWEEQAVGFREAARAEAGTRGADRRRAA